MRVGLWQSFYCLQTYYTGSFQATHRHGSDVPDTLFSAASLVPAAQIALALALFASGSGYVEALGMWLWACRVRSESPFSVYNPTARIVYLHALTCGWSVHNNEACPSLTPLFDGPI